MKFRDQLIMMVLLLHHFYIVLLNTSTVHGLIVPDETIWTSLLVAILIVPIYEYLKDPATVIYEKLLYIAIILSFVMSILRGFGITTVVRFYGLSLLLIIFLTTISILWHRHFLIKIFLFSIYISSNILYIARVFDFDSVILEIGPIVEILILLTILAYNYSLGLQFDELFIVILVTAIGWFLGDYLYTLDVPALIISTLFEQTLSLGQYSLANGIDPQFFLALHMAQVFNVFIILTLTNRSWKAFSIIATGIDMTYPPLLATRAILILIFMRETDPDYVQRSKTAEQSIS